MEGVDAEGWAYSRNHGEVCRVVETLSLWGETVCRVWLPSLGTVLQVPASQLQPLSSLGAGSAESLAYTAAAAKVEEALGQDLLLSPIEASVVPLPHQLRVLARALSGDKVRYLLADEVGLGKTVEAGLILRELKLRGLVTRTLVLAPRGLVPQWVGEMRTHFGEDFRVFVPNDFALYRRIAAEDNAWRTYPQVVCSMDSVKPLERRRGWSKERLAEYNRERFEDLVGAGWDLVIVDEAHRLGGSTEQVARFKLGQGLAEASPYFLLLSATPHQGKSEAFQRLLSLLDADAFPDPASVTRERVQRYVLRTEKRRAIDAEGKPLFKPRRTQLEPVRWEERHGGQRLLYEAVTEYVREGYNRAEQEHRTYVSFLMILFQRLVVSSTRAIRTTLERRLEALEDSREELPPEQLYSDDEWAELDGEEQVEALVDQDAGEERGEPAELRVLLKLAARCEAEGPDAKAEALLGWLYRLQQEEGDPDLKVLLFTEFVPTQQMLRGFLTDRGFSVVCLNGSMDLLERGRVQEAFAGTARVLVSTDAGGEGLNLQFAHVVVNYDIPWNPMRLEQRIGRVDRIGQSHTVRALNFVFEGSVEHRVREVLEEKLALILKEFGVDKTGDVLDSAQAGALFDDLYVDALLHPEAIDANVEGVLQRFRDHARNAREAGSLLATAESLDPNEARRLLAHPLPYWVERMTVNWLRSRGGRAEKKKGSWSLVWPAGDTVPQAVFTAKEAEQSPRAQHLTLEDPRVRALASQCPRFVPGQPVPCVRLPGLAAEVVGLWSLWRVGVHAAERSRWRVLASFVHDDGRVFPLTARAVWDQLLSCEPVVTGSVAGPGAEASYASAAKAVDAAGETAYRELLDAQRHRLLGEREKGEYLFAVRRRAAGRIGLVAVRNHRLAALDTEERAWREELARQELTLPDLEALVVVRIEGGVSDG